MVRAGLGRSWLIIALVCAIGCAGPNTPRTGSPAANQFERSIEIELDVFSGRPNPTWTASPERAASLSRGLSSLPDAPAQPEPGHLGYRGFIIRQGALRTRVYDGHVFVTTNGTTRTFVDSTGLEAQLIDDARQRGFGGVIRK